MGKRKKRFSKKDVGKLGKNLSVLEFSSSSDFKMEKQNIYVFGSRYFYFLNRLQCQSIILVIVEVVVVILIVITMVVVA